MHSLSSIITSQSMKFTIRFILLSVILIHLTGIKLNADDSPQNIITSFNQRPVTLKHWMITEDKNPSENITDLPDSSWIPLERIHGVKKYFTGNWFMKTEILVEDSSDTNNLLGLALGNFISAYDIYWDGIKIFQNGVRGTNINEEVPGIYENHIILPMDLLTPGKHSLVFRISHYRDYSSWKWFNASCSIGSYALLLESYYIEKYKAFLIAGLLLIPFLFNIFLYVTRKQRLEHLLFGICCLLVILDFLTNQISFFFDVPTINIHWKIYIYYIVLVLNSILFPLFLLYMFSFSKKWIMPVILTLNLIVFFFFTTLWNMFQIMSFLILTQSTLISAWAILKSKEGSIIILSGILAAWLGYFYNITFANLTAMMVVCTSISIARQFARTEKKEKLAQLRLTRLENELLKKNINPHFLMNTLTSIIAWLRKEPECAVNLIEALADEFRMITQISNLNLISVRQEVELCRAHLKIMSYRKGADFQLMTNGIKEEESVPPMIFHTLIENGLTHGYGNKNKGTFNLKRNESENGIEYIVSNDGEFAESEKKNSNGLGLQYVETRLEESFPGKWELSSSKQANCWEVIIKIEK